MRATPFGRPRPSPGSDSGSATVEFALVAPAVLLLVGGALSGMGLAAQSVRLADAAGAVARALGRGDSEAGQRLASELAPGVGVTVSGSDPVCVHLDASGRLLGALGAVPLTARSCAPGGGG